MPGRTGDQCLQGPLAPGTSYSIQAHVRASTPGCTQNPDTRAPGHHRTHCYCCLLLQHESAHTDTHSPVCVHTPPRVLTHRHMECAQDREKGAPCQQQEGLWHATSSPTSTSPPIPASPQPGFSRPGDPWPLGKAENVCDTCEVSKLWLSYTTRLREPAFQGRWADGRKDGPRARPLVHSADANRVHGEERDRLCAAGAQCAGRFLLAGGAGAGPETAQRWHQPDLEQVTQSHGRMERAPQYPPLEEGIEGPCVS